MHLSPRCRVALGVLALVAVVSAAAAAGLSGGSHRRAASRSSAAGAPSMVAAPAGWSLIATVKGTIPRYAQRGASPDGTVPARWHESASALPVIDQRPGWLEVRLATRPNGSTAWVRRSDVAVTATPYRIAVNLSRRHLQLFQLGKLVLDAPAGIGSAQDPTPAGQFFVALFEQPANAGYGPFILVTSAHSDTIADWEHSGDALIGIHGPLGGDDLINSTGAALSHGCIRLHLPDLARLRQVPAGTPVSVTA
jgi:lipoprotein-anchoring transpeptidase ErfK/SrfK